MKSKITLPLILALFFSLSSSAQTKLGLRANSAPTQIPYYDSLNAVVGRQIIKDHWLSPAFIQDFKTSLQTLKTAGVETIVCLRFPTELADLFEADRVPYLDPVDLDSSLAKVRNLITELDPVLDVVQIQNEPLFGPGKYIDTLNDGSQFHYGYWAFKWMDTLAYTIKQTIIDSNLSLSIMGPAFHNVSASLETGSELNPITFINAPGDTVFANDMTATPFERTFEQFVMEISKSHCDMIDVHMNVDAVPEIQIRIDLLDSLQSIIQPATILPYTTMEWSQTKEKVTLINSSPVYQQLLFDAYIGLLTLAQWQSFILDSLQYDLNFMQDAYCVMNSNNFVHACYAGLIMYGGNTDLPNQIFSTCALITNKVTIIPAHNEPFWSNYIAISTSNCNLNLNESAPRTELNVSAWPNPFNNKVNIISNEGFNKVTIVSMNGQVVFEETFSVKMTHVINTPLPSGVYLLTIESGNKKPVIRLVKE